MESNFVFIIVLLALWGWGAYKGWSTLTGKNEWLDRKEPVSYIVKGVVCVVLGIFFAIWKLLNLAMKLMGFFFNM